MYFSCRRLCQVQSLLREAGSATPDGILCSLGIDSRYNEGCTELAKYLFYGLYGRNQPNLEHVLEELPEDMLDDLILLIKAECVHLYCNPINYSYLLPYVSHWRNLHLYCMTEAEYEDEEAAEEFKISSFVSMVQDCYRIGVPYSSQGHMQRFDMFMVEKWPLIQAFALEGIGRGSFFTMKYKLMDMSEKLWQVYNRFDTVSLNHVFLEDLVNFEKQWSCFFSSMDLESHLSILELSEAQAGEVCSSPLFLTIHPDSQPFMLFGKHSSSEDLDSYSFSFASESHQVRNTGPRGSAAKHMILQCVAPKGPLSCSRTYFFGNTHTPLLSQIYSAAVQAVLSGIKCYSCTTSTTKEFCVYSFTLKHLFFPIVTNAFFSKASMTVHDIPDPQLDGGDLGSVVFSESFLESSITIQQKGKIIFFSEGLLFIHSQYGSITLSKNHISTIKFYDPDSSGVAALFVEYESNLLPHLPFPLHSSDQCLVFALQPRSKSHRAFYSKVLSVWKSSESGLSLQMVDQECDFTVKLLNFNKLVFSSMDLQIYLTVSNFLNRVKMSCEPFFFITDCCILFCARFFQHFALSSMGQEPILYDHLGALFPSAELRNSANSHGDKVVITIVTGLPGSHKKRLCNFLVQLNMERGRWVVYQPGPESSDRFSASHLQQFLSGFLESQRGPGGKPRLLVLSPGYTDVLDVVQAVLFHPDPVVQACFTIGAVTACVDPLASCMEHRFAFPKLLEQCSQGIVSTVVFTGLTAEQKHPLMQHVQQLVRSANPTAAFIQAERGAVTRNEDVNLILSDSSFNEPQMLRARYILYPGWMFKIYMNCYIIDCCFIILNAKNSHNLSVALRSSLGPSPFQGNVYNVWGKVRFSDSEQLMEVSYNTVRESLSIVPDQNTDPQIPGPKESSTSCFLIFDGVGLTEDEVKDWLRLCTKQPRKTKNSLSPQEIRHIHVSAHRHLDPLPPGYFYNGYQYVDVFGDKKNLHPNMEEFIKEYITKANKEIELFNRQLELHEQPDLFDP
uniref:Uncharacterized protein n=1 Tax=Mola mola TaxID=94237 RepID=A0A3Q3XGX3_MOLML